MFFLADNKQFLLCCKDKLKNVNLENVLKVANELVKTYDM